jgi:hypothetical protein
MVPVMRVSARAVTPAGAVVCTIALEAGAKPMTVSLKKIQRRPHLRRRPVNRDCDLHDPSMAALLRKCIISALRLRRMYA